MKDEELPLFGPPAEVAPAVEPRAHARTSDPQTSHDAARSVSNLRQSQEAVLDVFRLQAAAPRRIYGMTDEALLTAYAASGWAIDRPQSDSGLRTRRSELVALGLVVDSGDRVPLTSGRRAIVWTLATEADEAR